MEKFTSGEATVVKNDDGKMTFEIHDVSCRETFYFETIEFAADTFPEGTTINIDEPIPE